MSYQEEPDDWITERRKRQDEYAQEITDAKIAGARRAKLIRLLKWLLPVIISLAMLFLTIFK